MELRVLGTTEVLCGGVAASLGGPLQRAVIADLALSAPRTVSIEQLVDDLWDASQPVSAAHTLRAYVSRLRRSLAGIGCADAIVTSGPGYRLGVATSEVDVLLFSELVAHGRRALAGHHAAVAAERLRHALSLWRGPALADIRSAAFAGPAAARLEDSRLEAMEALHDARLQLGEHLELVSELERLIATYPLREHLHAQLMIALYRSGRQVDALGAFQRARNMLVEQAGLEPGRELRELELAVLHQAPELDAAPSPGRAGAGLTLQPPGTVGVSPPAEANGAVAMAPPTARLEGSHQNGQAASGADGPWAAQLAAAAAPGQPTDFPPAADRRRPRMKVRRWLGAGVSIVLIVAVGLTKLSGPAAAHPAAVGIDELIATTGRLTGNLSLPSEPGGAASGDGSVWVTSPVSGLLYQVDPATAAVEATVPVGNGAGAVVAEGTNVWVANTIDGTLSEVSAETDEVMQSIAVGPGPTGVAVGDGLVWVADAPASELSVLNPTTGRLTNFALSSSPFGVAFGASSVWLSSPGANNVTRFSTAGGPAVQIPVGAGPTAIAFGLGSVWVTNGLDNTVSRINPATDAVVATVPVGDDPDSLAVAGGSVWVANRLSSTLTRIDVRTNSISQSVATGGSPVALAVLGRGIWAPTAGVLNGGPSGGTLQVVSSVPTPSIDPALAFPWDPFQFFEGVYDTLVTYQRVGGDDGLQLVPDLALTMPTVTDDGTTYSFVLRPGLRYSDGQLLRPEDFRRAIERVLELNQNDATALSEIVGAALCQTGRPCDLAAGITVVDRADAVTFHLTAPDPNFLYQLASLFTAPVPAGVPDHNVGTRPVPSTGPYMIDRYVPGHEVVFVRNPYFREWSPAAEPQGSPERIVWTFGEPIPKEIAEIASGRDDWTNDFIPDVGALAARFPARVHANPAPGIDYVAFNTRVAPFNDQRVRQAFSLAANRGELVDMLGGPDAARPACQFLTPDVPGYQPYCPYTVDPGPAGAWLGPDLAAAQKLVAESGTQGMRVVFWNQPGSGPTSSFAVSVLRQLGYRVSMVSPSLNEYFKVINDSRSRAQVTDGSWYLDYPSASDLFDQFFRCSDWKLADPTATRNGSFFCDPRLDRQMDLADQEEATDPTQAADTWAAVDRELTDAAPWVVLVNLTQVDFLSSRVANYEYSPAVGVLLDQLVIQH
ncbi:MAG: ABC transporter substrate-binding protein [Acidimicrobiales bacterium]